MISLQALKNINLRPDRGLMCRLCGRVSVAPNDQPYYTLNPRHPWTHMCSAGSIQQAWEPYGFKDDDDEI